jgi:hypothetical protein
MRHTADHEWECSGKHGPFFLKVCPCSLFMAIAKATQIGNWCCFTVKPSWVRQLQVCAVFSKLGHFPLWIPHLTSPYLMCCSIYEWWLSTIYHSLFCVHITNQHSCSSSFFIHLMWWQSRWIFLLFHWHSCLYRFTLCIYYYLFWPHWPSSGIYNSYINPF